MLRLMLQETAIASIFFLCRTAPENISEGGGELGVSHLRKEGLKPSSASVRWVDDERNPIWVIG